MEENRYEKSLRLLKEFVAETPPEELKAFILKTVEKFLPDPVHEDNIYTQYDYLLKVLDLTLTDDQKEELGYCDEDTKKDATWRREHYGLPYNTIKGTHINFNNFDLIFNDNGDYLGSVFNIRKNGFISEKFDIEKIKIKLGI